MVHTTSFPVKLDLVYMAIMSKIYIQAWQMGTFPHLADGRKETENMLECMLPQDPTLSHKEYCIFSLTEGTIILSTIIIHASKYRKDWINNQQDK